MSDTTPTPTSLYAVMTIGERQVLDNLDRPAEVHRSDIIQTILGIATRLRDANQVILDLTAKLKDASDQLHVRTCEIEDSTVHYNRIINDLNDRFVALEDNLKRHKEEITRLNQTHDAELQTILQTHDAQLQTIREAHADESAAAQRHYRDLENAARCYRNASTKLSIILDR